MAVEIMKKTVVTPTEIKKEVVEQVPGKMNATDSLNVGLGLVHNYAEQLGKKIMSRPMTDSMKEMDAEAEDPNYLSDSKKHQAALELRSTMLEAKKYNKPLSSYKLGEIAGALHRGFIEKAANEAIANKKHESYQKIGEGLTSKD